TAIERAFDPYRKLFKREIIREDVLKLCEKPVRKISKFDLKKAEEAIQNIELNMDEVRNHLEHLVEYTIRYFKELKKKYGKGRERKTEIKSFDKILGAKVAVANQKLFVNRKEGFVGTALRKEEGVEQLEDCSDLDEVAVFGADGHFMVSKVSNKRFFFKDIIHVSIFKRNDNRTVYNMVYSDGHNGTAMAKRFSIGGITRDKEYDLTRGKNGSKVLYFTENPNGEAEKVKVFLKAKPKLKKLQFDFDFSTLAIKGRASQGNILSRHAVREVKLSEKGVSTLSAINVYFDSTVMKLNHDERGDFLGSFKEADKIITIYKSGYYRVTGYDLTTHFDDDFVFIQKYNPKRIITAVYFNKKEDKYFVKRLLAERNDKKITFIPDETGIALMAVSVDWRPQIEVKYQKKNDKELLIEVLSCADFVDVMNWNAKGKRLNLGAAVKSIKLLEPLPCDNLEEEEPEALPESADESLNDSVADIDAEIAKEIFDTIDTSKSAKTSTKPTPDDPENSEANQLSLF
ncbi:MAG: DNA gyrase/topoisomerase IV subunit A, partial [Bacteroidales bacterium]|nr:DNA gyrase/topoisomerase IV subunit A [Bacteroidales bacterium]